MNFRIILGWLVLSIVTIAHAQTSMDSLTRMPSQPVETRWFTFENPKGEKGKAGMEAFGRKGAAHTAVKNGKTLTLVDVQGSGTIRRMWFTLDGTTGPKLLRGLKLQAYWDGATTPAIEAPLGDFFCHGPGRMATFENACFASPEGRSFECFIAMPFRQSAKIVLVNESGQNAGVYYDIAATLGDKHDDDTLYFHSFWRRENYNKLREDVTILPKVEGRGRFLGCNIGIRENPATTDYWWGEGEVKIYLDGDTDFPTLCGTGTEDYIGDGYGQDRFAQRFTGCQYVNPAKTAYGFYRFHIPDPVYFHKDIRVTIQAMGGPLYPEMLKALAKDPTLKFMRAGKGDKYITKAELEKSPNRSALIERIDDFSTTAYWYMDKPENGLGPIAPVEERLKDIPGE